MTPEQKEAEEIGLEWLDRVERLSLFPSSVSRKLRELARLAGMAARRPDLVNQDGALDHIGGALLRLAEEVTAL